MSADRFSAWETLLARDPGGRGVAANAALRSRLGARAIQAAAQAFSPAPPASNAGRVAIVTGFCILGAEPLAAETDGPPGTLFLARVLRELGRPITLISDEYGLPLLEVGREFWGLDVELAEFPFEDGAPLDPPRRAHAPGTSPRSQAWIDAWLASPAGREIDRLVAIERAGPSHSLASIDREARTDPRLPAEFAAEVPPEHRDVCHNMRGIDITGHTAKTHLLFEAVASRRPDVVTLGLADGGNELGMGVFPWRELRDAIRIGPGGQVACRVPTEHVLLAGVSNWAAYALAAAVAADAGRLDLVEPGLVARELRAIELLVEIAGAVDGVTRQRRATVDGIDLQEYGKMLASILAAAALPAP